VCTARLSQFYHQAVADGDGGAIIVWYDLREGDDSGGDIWAQRIDRHGVPRWGKDGAPVYVGVGIQTAPLCVSDGAGGAIVTWWDARVPTPGIYAQRLNASGEQVWPSGGVVVDSIAGYTYPLAVASDAHGGAVVVFLDYHDITTAPDVYAQRLDANGQALWRRTGVPICVVPGPAELCAARPDGSGGAFIIWNDWRDISNPNLRVQHVDASGSTQWEEDGVQLTQMYCSSPEDCDIMNDGSGGAFVVWINPEPFGLYGQRISASGVPVWSAPGVLVSTNTTWPMLFVRMIPDGSGGFEVTYGEARDGSYGYSAYAQRMSPNGTVLWNPGGVELTTQDEGSDHPRAAPDGSGGLVAVWEDYRNPRESPEIYAQRVLADGSIAPAWPRDGVPVAVAPNRQWAPVAVPVEGGIIAVWGDARTSWRGDVYAQRIRLDGKLGGPGDRSLQESPDAGTPSTPFDLRATTSPSGVDVTFAARSPAQASVDVYDVGGRLVRRITGARLEAGENSLRWDLRDAEGRRVRAGVYVLRLDAGGSVGETRVAVLAR
jgi:hypothetical protein